MMNRNEQENTIEETAQEISEDVGGMTDTIKNGKKEHKKKKKHKKKKSWFLKKRINVAVFTLCIVVAVILGFSAGILLERVKIGETAGNHLATVSGTKDMPVSQVTKKVQDSVVEISTESVHVDENDEEVSSEFAGSGGVLSEDGYIVTNNHVVENGTGYTVRLKNGESYEATLIGRDPYMDLAILRIDATGLTPVEFGDSDKVLVGDMVVAIGNPLGTLGGTVTSGIVSATNRRINLENGTMNLIQTDAAINPGNSGGGLFNGQGSLIGVVVAKTGGNNVEGLGYAIPINDAKKTIDELMEHGYVAGRTNLGISAVDGNSVLSASSDSDTAQAGVYIAEITGGSQAEKAGLQAGDKILTVNDKAVGSVSSFQEMMGALHVGDKVFITLERSRQTVQGEIVLEEYIPA